METNREKACIFMMEELPITMVPGWITKSMDQARIVAMYSSMKVNGIIIPEMGMDIILISSLMIHM